MSQTNFMVGAAKPYTPGEKPLHEWLTASRGFFITWIMLRHFASKGGPASWINDAFPLLRTFDVPTTYFFVLSGFIFSLGKTPDFSWASAARFWVLRIGRLYPLYALAILAAAPIGWVAAKGDLGVFLFSGFADLTFMQAWFEEPLYASWLMVAWFMSCIAFCYLAYPLLAAMFDRLGAGALVASAICLAAYAWGMGIYWDLHATDRTSVEMVRRMPVAPVPIFALGVCLGFLVKRQRLRLAWGLSVSLAGVTAYVLLALTPNGWHLFAAGPMWLPLILLLLGMQARAPAWSVRFGQLGFTLYMLHWPLLIYSRNVLKLAGLEPYISSPVYLLGLFAVLIPLAHLVYTRFERPAQDWIKGRIAA